MGRIYLKRRFTKDRMSPEVTDLALKNFGELAHFRHT